jgi:DNA-binding NarL/FixJ family response regulator
LQAMTALSQGGTYFSRAVMQKLVDSGGRAPPPTDFTPREVEMLLGIARGWDNRRIAAEFDLAEQTVRNYISRIYDKLGVHSRAEAVVWARQQGYAKE